MFTIRRSLLLGILMLAGGGAIAAAAGSIAWAIVGLNLAVLAAFGWVLLWARNLESEISRLRRSSRAGRKEITGLRADVGELRSGQERTETDAIWIRRQLADDGRVIVMMRQLNARIATLHAVPSQTVELSRRYQQLVRHDRLMPAADGRWAVTAGTLVWLLDQVASGEVSRILECGSGASTVWFAAALEERGDGHVFALESDPAFAEQTRSHLAKIGLSHRADVIDAPLVDLAVNGREPRPWYDLSGLPDAATDIDLLLVDGPPGRLAQEVRYPAFPVLASRLAENAVVVLDDTIRPDEENIIDAWLGEEHAGRRLERIDSTDRSTMLRAVSAPTTIGTTG